MKNNIRRFTAIFLLVNILTELIYPSVAWALTSGPNAPDFTSFEPVDTNDMINLATGDLAYNIPVIEVPGPEGGYPLSLSYHAGIMPNQEASWVGLGWTLNAGAITRTVNGYPDDHHSAARVVTDKDPGGVRHTVSVGVGVPGAGFNLHVAHDSNLGLGIGPSVGVNVPLIDKGGLGVNIGMDFKKDPFGNGYMTAGANLSIGKTGEDASMLSANLGLSTNFKTASLYGSVNSKLMQASISSHDPVPSLRTVGLPISQVNLKAGDVTIESIGFSVSIPLKVIWLNIGYNYMRYYLDETDFLNTYGSLYASPFSNSSLETESFDSYALPESENTFVENRDANKQSGGSFAAYDIYSVNAQGLSGTIQPYIYQNMSLARQKIEDDIHYEIRQRHNGEVKFRFENDFSNSLTLDDDFRYNHQTNSFENAQRATDYQYGFKDNHLAGSKHVEWFTNNQIRNGEAYAKGLVSPGNFVEQVVNFEGIDISSQIGGFKITNSNGITYHFAQPAYAYNEFFRIQDKENPSTKFHARDEKQPYAYQWLLTAITGPDYVDRGEPGLDEEDWGYWVGFTYEKYLDNHQWRNPATGFHSDIDLGKQMYSSGLKEIYYLDAVFTRTHTALFHKEERLDGREVSSFREGGFENYVYNPTYSYGECMYECAKFLSPLPIRLPHLKVRDYLICWDECHNTVLNPDIDGRYMPRPLKQLTKVTLHKNTDLKVNGYQRENSLRAVSFNYDYSLQREVPNSYNLLIMGHKLGKLTLNKLTFLGKKEQGVIPPMTFEYDLPYEPHQVRVFENNLLEDNSGKIEMGDILKFTEWENEEAKDYFILITREEGNRLKFKFLGNNQREFSTVGILKSMQKTKNPPYEQESYDIWGMYKPDYDAADMEINESLARRVTDISSQSADAWCLRKIGTSMGADIALKYESDSYQTVSMVNNSLYNIKDMKLADSPNLLEIELLREAESFEPGQKLNISGLGLHTTHGTIVDPLGNSLRVVADCEVSNCQIIIPGNDSYFNFETKDAEIVNVEGNKIVVFDPVLYNEVIGDKIKAYNNVNSCCSGLDCSINNYVRRNCSITFSGFFDHIAGGYLSTADEYKTQSGGGLRVSAVEILNGPESYKTTYSYDVDGISTGYCSYEPFSILEPWLNTPPENSRWNNEVLKTEIRKIAVKEYAQIITIARELPPPGVIYNFVAVEEEVNGTKVPGKKLFEFEVFNGTMVEHIQRRQEIEERTISCTIPSCEQLDMMCEDSGFIIGECNIPCYEARALCRNGQPTDVEIPNYVSVSYPMTIQNYSLRVGNLKSINIYGKNDVLLSRSRFDYLHDFYEDNEGFKSVLDAYFHNQGVMSQAFNEFKSVRNPNGSWGARTSLSKKVDYPNIMIRQTHEDFKSKIKSEIWNLGFDFLSGAVTKTLMKDGYDNYILSETVPAFRVPEYKDTMGLALYGGKNMLGQTAANYTYKVASPQGERPFEEALEKLGLLGASITTWSDQIRVLGVENQPGIMREHQSFAWNGTAPLQADGAYPVTDFESHPFNFASPQANVPWEKRSEHSLINVYSKPLEAQNLHEDYSAVKLDPYQRLTTVSASPARYAEFSYSGAEFFDGNDRDENGVNRGQGSLSTTRSHTGNYSLLVSNGSEGFNYTLSASEADLSKPYKASVWVYLPGDAETAPEMLKVKLFAEADGQRIAEISPKLQENKSKSWYLMDLEIMPPPGTETLKISCENDAVRSVYFDDFRAHPLHAHVNSYVYDPFTLELIYILDKDNLYTRFEYDASGRLVRTSKEIFYVADRPVSQSILNYGKK